MYISVIHNPKKRDGNKHIINFHLFTINTLNPLNIIMKKATKLSLLFNLLFRIIAPQAAGQNYRKSHISPATLQGHHPVPEGMMELIALLSFIDNKQQVFFQYEDPYLEKK